MTGAPLRVLLVEDDEDDYLITRDLLQQALGARHQLDWISDFEQALGAIAEGRHDVYLIDYQLGTHSGVELMSRAKADDAHAPFIMLTGQGDEDVAVEAMKRGYQDYVVKGEVSVKGLARAIKYAIERSTLYHELQSRQRALNVAQDEQLRLKDEFLSHVSHELRTPLSVIHQFLSLLLDGLTGDLSAE